MTGITACKNKTKLSQEISNDYLMYGMHGCPQIKGGLKIVSTTCIEHITSGSKEKQLLLCTQLGSVLQLLVLLKCRYLEIFRTFQL